MTFRSTAQRHTSKINGSKGTGPVTADGRSRSSLNAIRGGERARRVLVQGESVESYLAEAQPWVVTLQPVTPAEDEVLFDLADVQVRLRRIQRAERRLVEDAITKEVSEHIVFKRLHNQRLALALLSAMKRAVTHPGSTGDGSPLVGPIQQVVSLLKEVEGAEDRLLPGVAEFESSLEGLVTWTEKTWPTSVMAELGELADSLLSTVSQLADRDAEQVRLLEEDLATRAVPSNSPQAKRLAAYRRELERQLQHHLSVFAQLKTLRPPPSAASGSFVRPLTINLRGQVPARA